MARWFCRGRWLSAGLVTGLFPPQEQAWGLDSQVGLTPQALAKVCRESATTQSFDVAADSINEDWGTHYEGQQMRRWSEYVGGKLVELEQAERKDYGKGKRPEGPANGPELLVVGLDGGRVQGRDKDPQTKSRWKEDKVATISSYLKGDGKDRDPERLVTSYVATMGKSQEFGTLARVESERRGIRQAREVVVMGDGAAWIDTVHDEHFPAHERIVDYSHASERLWDCAKALEPGKPEALGERLESDLYEGRLPKVIEWLEQQAKNQGAARAGDPEHHPRRVLGENLTYFQRHRQHMDYPRYRARGWPIGSGVTESGVKLFNKRVKGTEQFWNTKVKEHGVEAILALRALRLSEDDRWRHYMLYGRLLRPAA
jgi:hypothetical protein